MTLADSTADLNRAVIGEAEKLLSWLLNDALPRWNQDGIDRAHGGFHESLDPTSGTGCPVPKRARVAPRQIYSFIEGGRLGWPGDWKALCENGLDWFCEVYMLPDGLAGSTASPDGSLTDLTFDLYNQAFALFVLGQAASALPERKKDLLDQARHMLTLLKNRYAHPELGFLSGSAGELPLCSNPHMHLLEAALCLEEVDHAGPWRALADDIVTLARTQFIDAKSGGLREFFNHDWSPMPGDMGRIMEPGHQFEWCWLLIRWGRLRNETSVFKEARRLYDIGRTHGIDEERQVAVMALNDDFTVRDPLARLWGQTEWIKAALALADITPGPEGRRYLADVPLATGALWTYLNPAPKGLWVDKYHSDGSFTVEPVPASSLYHIVCAISELHTFAHRQPE